MVIKMYEELRKQAESAVKELIEKSKIEAGEVLVVGCSSSEAVGADIGTDSNLDAAKEIFAGIYDVLCERGIYLAAQCCEHLNRALIIERDAALRFGFPMVNVVPQIKAGGSFATCAYKTFEHPVAIEWVQTRAGLDIGGTLIGMHIMPVAVPVKLEVKKIGQANVTAARSRLKFIGGNRAIYNKDLM